MLERRRTVFEKGATQTRQHARQCLMCGSFLSFQVFNRGEGFAIVPLRFDSLAFKIGITAHSFFPPRVFELFFASLNEQRFNGFPRAMPPLRGMEKQAS